ncbi:sap62 [[Candida] subhashii]|uniref:Sap62 n=1 Tax=[Candida] subhashii TaxID=561895 RepID=A0A8J5UQ71_9ASCO|nr:sap62 [[Candida] subhashii]KAG7663992.1 sap62 [[Candida] subhashii]
MDYSDRVNAKKGAGAIAGTEETNVHTKKRIQDLLATHVLDLDNDPYVFRNHLGFLECKLCLTTHVSESSYISHLGGRKHQLNLERRRILDEKYNQRNLHQLQDKISSLTSINNVEKRSWKKIGKPQFKLTKIRDPDSLKVGLLINVKLPKIGVEEPFFRIMSYYELTSKNQITCMNFIEKVKQAEEDDEELEANDYQYLVVSAEPYDNIAVVIPNTKEIDKPQDNTSMSDTYWWYWDRDTKELFIQFMYK